VCQIPNWPKIGLDGAPLALDGCPLDFQSGERLAVFNALGSEFGGPGLPALAERHAALCGGEREPDHHPQRLARRGEYSRIYHDVTQELITAET
jgi:hypothetical protein